MTAYLVTTAQTVYERYAVEAESPEEASRLVSDSAIRATLPAAPHGDNDDEHVIDVRPNVA